MKSLYLFWAIIFSTNTAFAEVGDGVIFDENGLTIKYGKPPVFDANRWNSSNGTFTLRDGSAGFVKAVLDAQGKAVGVRKNFPQVNVNELRVNGLYYEPIVTVTSKFCQEMDESNFPAEANKCQDFLVKLFNNYDSQLSQSNFKTLQEVASYDGEPAPNSLDDMKKALLAQSQNMKLLEGRSIIKNISYLVQKCDILKRFSTTATKTS
ncbi:MAG: hypothetical protein K2Q18_01105, partial [Bdellovibrionales bacterium]|nr:hypothetical protein [Bdellovibrionales bacterium]